jgi:hypothetical protein
MPDELPKNENLAFTLPTGGGSIVPGEKVIAEFSAEDGTKPDLQVPDVQVPVESTIAVSEVEVSGRKSILDEPNTFIDVFFASFKMCSTRLPIFLVIFGLNIVLLLAAQYGGAMLVGILIKVYAPLSVVGLVLLAAAPAFVNYLTAGAMSKEAFTLYSNQEKDLPHLFSETAAGTLKVIGLMIRIFFYSGAWIIGILMLASLAINIYLGIMAFNKTAADSQTANKIAVLDKLNPAFIAFADNPLSGIVLGTRVSRVKTAVETVTAAGQGNTAMNNSQAITATQAVSATQIKTAPTELKSASAPPIASESTKSITAPADQMPAIAAAVGGQSPNDWAVYANYGLMLLMLIAGLFAAVRSFNAIFAFHFLMAHPEISTREALQRSIETMKGNWWKVIIYNVFFIIAVTLPITIIIFVIMNLFKGSFWIVITPILTMIFTGLIISFNSVFQQYLAQELHNKKRYSISVIMKVTTAVIIILPILAVAGYTYLLPIILQSAIGG